MAIFKFSVSFFYKTISLRTRNNKNKVQPHDKKDIYQIGMNFAYSSYSKPIINSKQIRSGIKMKNIYVLTLLLMSFLVAQTANAGIIELSTPLAGLNPLEADGLENNTNIHLLTEQQNFTLTSNLLVDQLINPANLVGPLLPSGGQINAGTMINSFLFHFDAVGDSAATTVSILETYTFDYQILAVIWSGPVLAGSDAGLLASSDYLGLTQTYYTQPYIAPAPDNTTHLAGVGRGLEPSNNTTFVNDGTVDSFRVSGNQLNTIDLSFKVQPKFADQLRVITGTTPVPAPGGLWLVASGLLGMAGFMRNKKTLAH